MYTKITADNKRIFICDNWKEWIVVFISGPMIEKGIVPKFYVPLKEPIAMDGKLYYHILISPFVFVYYWIEKKWFKLARYIYKKGYIKKKEECSKRSWFWLKDISFKKL